MSTIFLLFHPSSFLLFHFSIHPTNQINDLNYVTHCSNVFLFSGICTFATIQFTNVHRSNSLTEAQLGHVWHRLREKKKEGKTIYCSFSILVYCHFGSLYFKIIILPGYPINFRTNCPFLPTLLTFHCQRP